MQCRSTGLIWSSMFFWAIWHLFQKNLSKYGTMPAEKLKSQNLLQIGQNFQKMHNIIILSHKSWFWCTIPMKLIESHCSWKCSIGCSIVCCADEGLVKELQRDVLFSLSRYTPLKGIYIQNRVEQGLYHGSDFKSFQPQIIFFSKFHSMPFSSSLSFWHC